MNKNRIVPWLIMGGLVLTWSVNFIRRIETRRQLNELVNEQKELVNKQKELVKKLKEMNLQTIKPADTSSPRL